MIECSIIDHTHVITICIDLLVTPFWFCVGRLLSNGWSDLCDTAVLDKLLSAKWCLVGVVVCDIMTPFFGFLLKVVYPLECLSYLELHSVMAV
jgi:hypothetical protein